MGTGRKEIKRILMIIFWVFAASFCRSSRLPCFGTTARAAFALIRPLIYIGLFFAWSNMVRQSIINTFLRMYLLAVAYGGIFLILIRTIKFEMTIRGDCLNLFLQYAYYIPTILIPTFTLFSALHTRRSENYKIPKRIFLPVVCISLTLLMFVFTNNFHHLFYGCKNGVFTVQGYTYGILYYIVLLWISLLILASVIIILMKARSIPNKRLAATKPFIVMGIIAGYFFLEKIFPHIWKLISSDWSAFTALAFIAVLDSCITSGMVPSNRDYEKLFRSFHLPIVITDDKGKICFSTAGSDNFQPPAASIREETIMEYDRHTHLKSYRLHPGYAVWREDISGIQSIIEELQDNCDQLSSRNALDQENLRIKLALQKAQESNRLFGLSQNATRKQTAALGDTLDGFFAEREEEKKTHLLEKAAILGAYIKRRGNLIFVSEHCGSVRVAELKLCFYESLQYISLTGADCFLDCRLPEDMALAISAACCIYDTFETLVEYTFGSCDSVFVHMEREGAFLSIFISMGTEKELKEGLLPSYAHGISEEGSLNITLYLPVGEREGEKYVP